MTIGVGGKSKEEALASLHDMTGGAQPIGGDEHRARIAKAQAYMRANKIDAVYLNAGSSLLYFTGVHWHGSERMVGAVLPASGEIEYIAPKFEEGTLNNF
ncbi:MAG: aminopeptidase P family N-terminal domain-containing protein, partial [Dongia sp.]